MALTRLDKLLADSGAFSRSEARACVRDGRVLVNGKAVFQPDAKFDPDLISITVDGAVLNCTKTRYLMLYKPAGVLSATEDPQQETVIDLLPEPYRHMGLFPVGRLDKDTTGLLLLTNDGDFCHNLTSPKKEKQKVYEFTLKEEISNLDIQKLQNGVTLKDGTKTKQCKIQLKTNLTGTICITEGKYHQVRRMFASVCNKIIALNRVEIAGVRLDNTLALGEYRHLTDEELAKLKV